MSSEELGRLKPYKLREQWPNEADDFTPWLADKDNIHLLGDVLGLELEVEGTEQQVGPFSADILCKDTMHNRYVVIENQLEKTDHTHLGQIITYAAGLDAAVIVWISKRFTEEHRAAIDWLNNHTGEDVNFFALEIELWKIGDSAPAPKFNVVCKPNEWTKAVVTGSWTDTQRLRFEFWSTFREYLIENGDKSPPKATRDNWLAFSVGRTGFYLSAVASKADYVKTKHRAELRLEFNLDGANAKVYFAMLQKEANAIQQQIGETLTWYSKEKVRSCRVYVQNSTDFRERDKWPEQHEWLWKYLKIFDEVFRPRVKNLVAPAETEIT